VRREVRVGSRRIYAVLGRQLLKRVPHNKGGRSAVRCPLQGRSQWVVGQREQALEQVQVQVG
jgi:hypothetical protein